ncbi:MAG: ABC transporter ATP-binding protein [Synergistaceae bacterium]|jgi:NitT/TauT family transport system ATP-binding protein|nr:ABC transporter ATP-binding protein [Synergistaceae bacterium]
MIKLKVDHIRKTFSRNGEEQIVLEDVSFSVDEGRFVSILGPSGCGKTTLLSILAGFQRATGGSITLGDRKVSGPGPDRGFVFQNYALFPWMTVRENVMFPMKRQRIPKDQRERTFARLIGIAQLEGRENFYPKELSGGMKQRTAFIRALAGQPEILLMDEPMGAVDFQMRQKLQEELESLWLKERITVIMVTHDVDEAVYLSDRVIVLSARRGCIMDDSPIDLPRPRDRDDQHYEGHKARLSAQLRMAFRES